MLFSKPFKRFPFTNCDLHLLIANLRLRLRQSSLPVLVLVLSYYGITT